MDDAALLDAFADAAAAASKVFQQRASEVRAAGATRSEEAGGDEHDVVSRARAIHPQLGQRQAEVLTLLDEAGSVGTDTGVLHRQMNYDQPNVYLTLQQLVKLGFVAKDPEATPHRYSLGSRLTG